MPDLTVQCSPDGPLVHVDISPSTHYQLANFPKGSPAPVIQALFLVDTGASHCMIDEPILAPLKLTPRSGAFVRSAATGKQQLKRPRYDLSLLLYDQNPARGWFHGSVSVTAAEPNSFDGALYRGIIGRNVLDLGVLFYDGPNKQFRLTW